MYTILFYDLVDDYLEKRGAFRELHLDLARQAHQRGEIALAGALAEPRCTAIPRRLARCRGSVRESRPIRQEWAGEGVARQKMEHRDRRRLTRI